MKRLFVLILLIGVGIPAVLHSAQGDTDKEYSVWVDDDGAISLPADYRSGWVHLGSWIVPDAKAQGHGFHDVYTQPETVEAYKKDGKFPDGAVLVKEIRKVESAKLTTGEASWAGDIAVWFVMVRDTQGRFADNPNWGNGWGWALFEADDPTVNTSASYKIDCLGCHVPAKGDDWVFVDGYPTLK